MRLSETDKRFRETPEIGADECRSHKAKPELPTVDFLVDELFSLVQCNQGYFHISDGEIFDDQEALFRRIRGRLEHGKEAVHKMERWLQKYGQAQGQKATRAKAKGRRRCLKR